MNAEGSLAAAVPSAPRRILAVDDDPEILSVLETLLSSAGYSVLTAHGGREAIEIAGREKLDLVLLDVMMPEISGWEVCTTLKSAPETQAIPVVMLTVKNQIRDMITSMQAGADDYLTKPFTKRRLLSAVEQLLENRDLPTSRLVISAEEQFRNKNLLYDSITQLPTVVVVIDALRDRLLDNRDLGVLYVDVEKYSHIEDVYGWEVFDALVRETSQALKRLGGSLFSPEDIVAINRPAGSEFNVFTQIEAGDQDGERLARKARQTEEILRETLDEKFRDRIHKPIGVFVGHSTIHPSAQMRVERVVYRALREAALVATSREEERRGRLRKVFAEVVSAGQIRTLFQPIFDLKTSEVFGHEALTRGPVGTPFESPDLLFEFAVSDGSAWELESLCLASTARNFHGKGTLFVNLEADVVAAIAERGVSVLDPLAPRRRDAVLEVTERSAIRDMSAFRSSLDQLRSLGYRIAIDDAGSGYASLQTIVELRPNFLKIANTLVTGLAGDPIKRDIVEMLLHVADRIGAICVAEGIETIEDLEECRRIGIAYGQGFYLAQPADSAPGAG